jgi:hypothetical protein
MFTTFLKMSSDTSYFIPHKMLLISLFYLFLCTQYKHLFKTMHKNLKGKLK